MEVSPLLQNSRYWKWYALAMLIVLCSCGMVRNKFGRLPGGYTNLTVTIPQNDENGFLSWPNVYGGMMVYIVGVNGTPFSTTLPLDPAGSTNLTASIGVPNGIYHIYALAWAGSSKLTGQVGCGRVTSDVILSGGSQAINLNVSNTTTECNYTGYSPFATSGYNTINSANFPSITVFPCNGLTTSGCTTTSPSYNTMSSVLVRAEGYIKYDPNVEKRPEFGIGSACTSLSGTSFPTAVNIPPGSTLTSEPRFIGTTIAFYPNSNTNCSGTPAKTVFFPGGLANGSPEASTLINNQLIYVNVGP